MSAYLETHEHISRLLQTAKEGAAGCGAVPVRWNANGPGEPWRTREISFGTTLEELNAIGRMLLEENAASVLDRYPDMAIEEWNGERIEDYHYRNRSYQLTTVEAAKALNGYEYQSCEHSEWGSSEAHRFIQAMREALLRSLPGYEYAGAWSISEEDSERREAAPRQPIHS